VFTDNPTLPIQLEVLLDVIYEMRSRRASPDALRQLIQPKGLADLTDSSKQFAHHLAAAEELELVRTDDNDDVRLSYTVRGVHRPRLSILSAFDRVALADARVEKWAGRFYAYLLVHENASVSTSAEIEVFVTRFMADLAPNVDKANQMNAVKYRALMNWYPYVGLGWWDPAGSFVPDPTERLRRSLGQIWGRERTLDADEFVTRLGRTCPELDGGVLFSEGTTGAYSASARRCTRALATALRRLHDEGTLILRCPADSRGWELDLAGSGPVSGEGSTRVDLVERVRGRE
jgi:hypothetical protein